MPAPAALRRIWHPVPTCSDFVGQQYRSDRAVYAPGGFPPVSNVFRTMRSRPFLKGCVLFLLLATGIYLLRVSGLGEVLDKHWMDDHIRDQGIRGYLLFLAISAGFTAVGLPRQIISFFAGYVYGVIAGTLVGVLGSGLGCALSFFYARLLGGAIIRKRQGTRTARLNAFLEREPFQMAVVVRLLPVGSNILTNLVAGVTGIPALPFLAGSLCGYLPQTLIFALLGSGVHVEPLWRTTLSGALLALSSVMGYRLYRRYRVAESLEVPTLDTDATKPSNT